jgi:hypothetical protein
VLGDYLVQDDSPALRDFLVPGGFPVPDARCPVDYSNDSWAHSPPVDSAPAGFAPVDSASAGFALVDFAQADSALAGSTSADCRGDSRARSTGWPRAAPL